MKMALYITDEKINGLEFHWIDEWKDDFSKFKPSDSNKLLYSDGKLSGEIMQLHYSEDEFSGEVKQLLYKEDELSGEVKQLLYREHEFSGEVKQLLYREDEFSGELMFFICFNKQPNMIEYHNIYNKLKITNKLNYYGN
jgi:hypothetical protein